jgi:ABC-type transport system substrate-binding protein
MINGDDPSKGDPMRALMVLFLILSALTASAQAPPAKVLRVGIQSDIQGTNPQRAVDSFSLSVFGNVFDTLVAFQPEGVQIIPALATEWTSDPGFRTWTFTLRQGVKFHDGTPLTVDAVVRSFKAIPGFPHAVSASGADKVVFGLSVPDANFIQVVAQPYYSIIAPKMIEDPAAVAGTGPFLYAGWEKGRQVVLKKNPLYWQKPAEIDEVRFIVFSGQAALLEAVATGAIDLVDYLVGNNLKEYRANPNLKVASIMGNSTGFLNMNTQRPPFNDKRVRKAVAMALNPFELTKRFFAGSAGAPASSMVPPTLFSHFSKNVVNQPEQAKALLKEAGWAPGKTFVLLEGWAARPYMPDPHGIALEVQKSLAAVGIQVRVERDPEHYFERLEKGDFDLILNGWIADTADPVEYLFANLHTKAIGQNNAAHWSDPAFDALIDASRTLKGKDLQAKLKEALTRVDEEVPLVPLFYGPQTAIHTKQVLNYYVHPFQQLSVYTVTLGN